MICIPTLFPTSRNSVSLERLGQPADNSHCVRSGENAALFDFVNTEALCEKWQQCISPHHPHDYMHIQSFGTQYVCGMEQGCMVQGSCATAPGPALSKPAGADLRPLLPGQCLLLTDTGLLTVSNSSLWLDNLYVRLKRSTRTPLEPVLLTTESESPALFLSGITLQVLPQPPPRVMMTKKDRQVPPRLTTQPEETTHAEHNQMHVLRPSPDNEAPSEP